MIRAFLMRTRKSICLGFPLRDLAVISWTEFLDMVISSKMLCQVILTRKRIWTRVFGTVWTWECLTRVECFQMTLENIDSGKLYSTSASIWGMLALPVVVSESPFADKLCVTFVANNLQQIINCSMYAISSSSAVLCYDAICWGCRKRLCCECPGLVDPRLECLCIRITMSVFSKILEEK